MGLTSRYGVSLHAYAVFSNHYHLIVETQEPSVLPRFVQHFHGETGRYANQRDHTPGRKVWYQYWDTYLDDTTSLYSRWKYVLDNPVRHGLVKDPEQYRWCSARAFIHLGSDRAVVSTVLQFKADAVSVVDDYEPLAPVE